MARSKNKNGFLSFIVWIAVILAACAVIVNFTKKNALALSFNGKQLENGSGGIELVKDEKYAFEILNAETEEQDGYTVKIVATSTKQTDFYYVLDDEWKKYSEVKEDLTKYFTITQETDKFTIVANYDIGEILSLKHGKTVEIAEKAVKGTADYFTMIVSFGDGSESISIHFRIGYPLSLDKEILEF